MPVYIVYIDFRVQADSAYDAEQLVLANPLNYDPSVSDVAEEDE